MAAGSANEGVGPGRLLSDVRIGFRDDGKDGWIPPVATFGALLLHALLIVGAFEGWPDAPPGEPEVFAELVIELPPPPEPEPPPAAEPQPQPQPPPPAVAETPPPAPRTEAQEFRQSGDPERKPGGAAEEQAPEPKAEPAEETVPEPPAVVAMTPPPTNKPAAPKRASLTPRPDTPNDPGEGEGGGDPYLNAIRASILKQHDYPAVLRPMRLSGVALYTLALRRDGTLADTKLIQSSGVGALDDAGLGMIRRAAPFPPVPSDMRGEPLVLTLRLYLGPEAR